ncbi:MAG: hypothetical protein WA138_16705 [Parvibaculum sp.]
MSIADQTPRDIEYEAIKEAIMQNPRGRWFLNEYARRNRAADTDRLVDAIEHLYKEAIRGRAQTPAPAPEPAPAPVREQESVSADIDLDRIRRALNEMRQQISTTRREMANVKPRESEHFRNDEPDPTAIAASAEVATLDILAAVERLQDIADTLRSRGADGDLCDEIETHARGIFMSSAYQDMTGQRITHLVTALNTLDSRLAAMLELEELSND